MKAFSRHVQERSQIRVMALPGRTFDPTKTMWVWLSVNGGKC